MAIQPQPNMGITDRMVRGTLGSALLLNGLRHIGDSRVRQMEALIGGAFLAYGVTGFDPLLAALRVNTIAGTETNVFNMIRHSMPGQGIRPILTQYVSPKKPLRPFDESIPLAQALSIG